MNEFYRQDKNGLIDILGVSYVREYSSIRVLKLAQRL